MDGGVGGFPFPSVLQKYQPELKGHSEELRQQLSLPDSNARLRRRESCCCLYPREQGIGLRCGRCSSAFVLGKEGFECLQKQNITETWRFSKGTNMVVFYTPGTVVNDINQVHVP